MNAHIKPREPHPRLRVRKKHAMRVLYYTRRRLRRWLDRGLQS